jgi:uncharacterized Ntn-hydrolase superfamily protein
MTYSLVARSDDGTALGVAVASKFLAVGAVVPAARAGVGALATQSLANLRYRPDGLGRLETGHSAAQTVAELTAADPQREDRQLGVVDGAGGSATFTGSHCFPWAGGLTGPGYAIQGNILTGPEVVEAMRTAWLASPAEQPLAHRMLGSLAAGDRAGGDSRGRQSAALLVVTPGGGYGGGSDVQVDLRVDDHPDPVTELARLLEIHDLLFGRSDPQRCLPLEGELVDEVRELLTRTGHPGLDLEASLSAWAGRENLEERLVPGRIDPGVLEHLRRQADDLERTHEPDPT